MYADFQLLTLINQFEGKQLIEISPGVPQAAYSVAQFCAAHGFTKVMFYKLMKQGRGPRIMKVGTRTLISVEAAADWRRTMEDGAEVIEPRHSRAQSSRCVDGAPDTGERLPASRKQAVAAGHIGGAE